MTTLENLAHAVLFPGLGRPTVPRWIDGPVEKGIGGFIIFGKDVASGEQLQSLTSQLRERAGHLQIALDEEGGDVTRLDHVGGIPTPGNLALGRIDDVETTREVAYQIGLSLRAVGVNWDLAPAVDTAVNPFSPNGVRCFSGDRAHVSKHAAAWVEGLQSAGVSACAKHFPGHGLSGTDAHLGTPTIDLSREELVDHYLDPFRAAIGAGVDSIMVSHPQVTALDTFPASISAPVITGLLREELEFDGVVITDALEMQGVASVAPLAEAAVRAIRAGADALCLGAWSYGDDARTAANAIVDAVQSGDLPLARLEQATDRIARLGDRRPSRDDVADMDAGIRAAREAIEVTGDPKLRGDAVLVVRLEPVASPAQGRSTAEIDQALARSGRTVETVAVSGDTYNGAGIVHSAVSEFRDEYGDRGDIVVLVRSPHRYAWQAPVLDRILESTPDAIVLDMGFVHRDFSGARGWIRTYGGSRACVAVASEVLQGS
jgi:beta-N-acetylhexosaminidase